MPRTLEDVLSSLATQFDIGAGQEMELMKRAMHCIKTSVDVNLLDELFANLPQDWRELIDIA